MRSFLYVSIVTSLTACFDPDFVQKPCDDQTGCPPTFTCVVGRCAAAQRCTSSEPSCDHGLVCNVALERCENPDMGSPTPDMSTSPPTLSVPAGCVSTRASLTDAWSIIGRDCTSAGLGCHATNGTFPNFGATASEFRPAVVGIFARRDAHPNLKYVSAGKIDDSFLLYKITGQQDRISTGLAQMPYPPRLMLSQMDQCTLINWVRFETN